MQHTINLRDDEDSELPIMADVMSRKAGNQLISARSAYHYLVNIDEFPEMLPLAHDLVASAIDSSKESSLLFPVDFHEEKTCDDKDNTRYFTDLCEHLSRIAKSFELDALTTTRATQNNIQNNHAFLAQQLAPTMHVSGCWLQNLSRVATAHTSVAGKLNKLFSMQTMAYDAAALQHTNQIGSNILNLFATFRESNLLNDYILKENTEDYSFEFPLLLLSFGQFPREFLPELLGLNLAWHHLGIHRYAEKITLENFLGSSLANDSLDALAQRDNNMADLSMEVILALLEEQNSADQFRIRRRILCGMEVLTSAWMKWLQSAKSALLASKPNPRTEMIELIRRKGPHGFGYHKDKRLGQHKIDELLDSNGFDPAAVIDKLANSSFVVQGDAAKSPFTNRLVEFGGPMAEIFTSKEITVICNWINSLATTEKISAKEISTEKANDEESSVIVRYPLWERTDFLKESREEYANRPCSLRELYYKLVNIEYFPDVLPVAEQFLIDRLNRSRSTLITGERPLPTLNYSGEALEKWVFNKHRQQIDAYQPHTGKPSVTKEAFIDATVTLAPLLLIDGGWLQGVTGINTIQTPSGLKLYRIFFEEIGLGNASLHHSNIYRELLESMGVELPDVTSLDFAFSDHFQDSAFEAPILWLSLSHFTRHYFPELLGINLAVELAGLGASYLEARDTLKYYGFPTVFVDCHNSGDNVSVGHAAWALEAIKIYMNEVAAREGAHNLDVYWHRLWVGMRLTLPVAGDYYWNPSLSASSPECKIHPVPSRIFN
jgi:hypothetical protein